MERILLSPPVAALLLFAVLYALSRFLSQYAAKSVREEHESDPYACGQRGVRNYVSPDYGEFFPFAALFTLMHVLILVVATAPREAVAMPVIFLAMALFALYAVFKKVK